MLNGIAPIIIFTFKRNAPSTTPSAAEFGPQLPVSEETLSIPLIPIPIYLDEKLTGILINSENKNIDVNTEVRTKPDGSDPEITQQGVNSSITIEATAKTESIGISILAAMADIIFDKVTSKEYSITYIHGAITVFGGLLDEFSITQNSENDLYSIHLKLSNSKKSTIEKAAPLTLPKSTGITPL